MRVLITGSSGRVGRVLAPALAAAGHTIVGFDLTRSHQAAHGHYEGSLLDRTAILAAAMHVDAIVHLGALMSWLADEAPRVMEINVTGTLNTLDAARTGGARRFIFASSGEVYPETHPQYLPIDEAHPTQPRSHYGLSKLLGEELVWFYARRYGLAATVLRLPHTQDAVELLDADSPFSGPRFFLRSRLRQARARGQPEIITTLEGLDPGREALLLSRGGDGLPYQMAISDTRDTAAWIARSLEAPASVGETIGIGPDDAVSFDSLVRQMQAVTGLPVVDTPLPGPPMRYTTSNAKARALLDFAPSWPVDRMLAEAAAVWRVRRAGGGATTGRGQ